MPAVFGDFLAIFPLIVPALIGIVLGAGALFALASWYGLRLG